MALLIDGYNLLYASGIFGVDLPEGNYPGGGYRSRLAMLNYLANVLSPQESLQATVVFDAKDAPPGLPRTFNHSGITVHFASNYNDADEMIEALLEKEPHSKRLTVVSSDHRVQRAARRKGAKPIDSDRWLKELSQKKRERRIRTQRETSKPDLPLSESEVAHWLELFEGEPIPEKLRRLYDEGWEAWMWDSKTDQRIIDRENRGELSAESAEEGKSDSTSQKFSADDLQLLKELSEETFYDESPTEDDGKSDKNEGKVEATDGKKTFENREAEKLLEDLKNQDLFPEEFGKELESEFGDDFPLI
ncbi:MAG: NYN domain-containing protein [Pirellulaceae bacterium]|nr:NYN domain-containing protein [Pirellulaceae bacterium]